MYLLDTCVISEIIKPQPDSAVVSWLRSQKTSRLFISAFTIGELRKGVDRLEIGVTRQQLSLWLVNLVEDYKNRVLEFDTECAILWGGMCALSERNGETLPVIESLIAATAMRYSCTLVTRNEIYYQRTGVSLLNPSPLWH